MFIDQDLTSNAVHFSWKVLNTQKAYASNEPLNHSFGSWFNQGQLLRRLLCKLEQKRIIYCFLPFTTLANYQWEVSHSEYTYRSKGSAVFKQEHNLNCGTIYALENLFVTYILQCQAVLTKSYGWNQDLLAYTYKHVSPSVLPITVIITIVLPWKNFVYCQVSVAYSRAEYKGRWKLQEDSNRLYPQSYGSQYQTFGAETMLDFRTKETTLEPWS